MTPDYVFATRLDQDLKPAPIDPRWIQAGEPVFRNTVIAESVRGCWAVLWECTAGTFEWHYEYDETLYILDGAVTIQSATMQPTRFGPGDVISFACGARARWQVDKYIRKLAICRRPESRAVAMVRAAWRRLIALNPAKRRDSRPDAGSMQAVPSNNGP